jgi:hypothetical protein
MSKTLAPPPIKLPTHKPSLRKMKAQLAADKSMLSKRDVRERIFLAIKTLDAVPDHELRFFRVKCGLPEFVRDRLEPADEQWVRNEELSRPSKFKPSPRDMERYIDDLSWLNPLTDEERDLLAWRARGFAYRDIAQWIQQTERQAENAFKTALSNCWCVAALTQRNANQKRDGKAL